MGRIIWRESDTLEIELNPNKHLLHFYANQMLGFAWGRRRGVRRMITWSCQEKVLRNCLMVHFHCVELGGPLLKHMYKFSFRIIFFFLSSFLSFLPILSVLPSHSLSPSLFFLSFPLSFFLFLSLFLLFFSSWRQCSIGYQFSYNIESLSSRKNFFTSSHPLSPWGGVSVVV